MTKKKITIKDIARECGVGLGTVSRAINNQPGVKEDIRRKILQHIEDIGWRSTSIYNRLKTSDEGKTVVFIASPTTFEKRFDNEFLRQLMETIPQQGLTPVVYYGRCRENLERCIVMQPFAVVIIGISDYQNPLVEKLMQQGTRVIGIGDCDDYACPLIFSDPRKASRQAVKFLKKAGHEKIGFFGGLGIRKQLNNLDEVNIPLVREMLSGICDAAPEFDFKKSAISDCFSDLSIFRKQLKSGQHTAWICSDEKMCRQLIYCANELKLSIPDDISLISFTPDLPFYSFSIDIARFYQDNKSLAAKVIELLSTDTMVKAEKFSSDYLYNKGKTVKRSSAMNK